ncbi:hypothetical protein [Nocardiopsis eucommiae]|uniref:hypothetical protein n=1 Tax=Nocardiopsis eucommiae TaxID=2831970 RepID=UPI003D72760C
MGILLLIVLSLPAVLALSWVHGDSRRRAVQATDELVVTGLVRERRERELDIERASFQKRLTAVRNCESRVYGYMPSSDHPEQLRAVVGPEQAREHLDELRESLDAAERLAKEQRKDLEHHLEEERDRIQALNRRFRAVDSAVYVSAAVLRVCLVATVLFALTALLVDLFS